MNPTKDLLIDAQEKALKTSLPAHLFGEVSEDLKAAAKKHMDGIGIRGIEDLNSEEQAKLLDAMVAECHSVIHYEFIENVIRHCSTGPHIKATPATSFIGDADKQLLAAVEQFFTEEATQEFIIVSPLVVAIMQSALSFNFHPAHEGTYQGSDFTSLVGEIDVGNRKVPVYVYLMNKHFDSGQYRLDWIIVGSSNEPHIDVAYEKIPFELPDLLAGE